jgi:hypothetical protein
MAVSAGGMGLPRNLIIGGDVPAVYEPYPVSRALSLDVWALGEE